MTTVAGSGGAGVDIFFSFSKKPFLVFLLFHENMHCGYSLEASRHKALK